MRFDGRHSIGFWIVLLGVLLSGNRAAAVGETGTVPEITVLVHDSAGISAAVLNQAALETARIFRAAGINIAWVDCSNGSSTVERECEGIPGPNQFVLRIVSQGKTSSDLVFGLAFLAEDGVGKYSDVFFERVEEAHREFGASVSRLLATVAAHELGHLLMGSHAHSHGGIMTPVWKGDLLRQMDRGGLLFTGEQASLMKSRIRGQKMTLVSNRATGGR